MAHKVRVPKTRSYTKLMCSECEKPVDFQGTQCAFCKATLKTTTQKTFWYNLIFIAAFAVFSYMMMG